MPIEWDIDPWGAFWSPFGGFPEQGSVYLVLFLLAAAVCALRASLSDRRYWWFPAIFLLNFFAFRAVDVGGFIGNQIIASAAPDLIVPYIALGLAGVDTLTGILLLLFCGSLLLSRVIAGLLACAILLAYLPAALGWTSGATGIAIANVIGIIQMAAIIGDASGGFGRLVGRDDRVGDLARRAGAVVARAAAMAPIPPRTS